MVCDIGVSFFVLWVTLLTCLDVIGVVTFGHGLGDIFFLLALIVWLLITIIYWVKRRILPSRKAVAVVVLMAVLTIVLSTLKMTVFRGPEYPWNGQLFL